MFGNATTTVDPLEMHIQSVEHLLEQVLADSRAQALRHSCWPQLRHEDVDPHERSNPCVVKRCMTAPKSLFWPSSGVFSKHTSRYIWELSAGGFLFYRAVETGVDLKDVGVVGWRRDRDRA